MEYLSSIATTALPKRDRWNGSSHQKKNPNPLNYPKSSQPFSSELFRNPTSEYRGCPFWAWNTKLEKGQLLRQIDVFQQMGMGGFHMHCRTGLDTEYMGSEFMHLVESCVEYAGSKNMLACLYDEDRWPSGSAGGLVIKEYPETKSKHLLLTPREYGTMELLTGYHPTLSTSSAPAYRTENGNLLAQYEIELDENGCLTSSRKLTPGETGSNVWYLYEETNTGDPWFNDQTYIDTMSENAMSKFIELTHEAYKAKIGSSFGTVVPCIFTDEPQSPMKTQLSNPRAAHDVYLPWTTDLADTFNLKYGTDLIKNLPEIVWNLPGGKASVVRYHYHDHVCERFVTAFMDQIAKWCSKNGLLLNGHMMEEPTLHSQTAALGEAMRCYRSMQMPGMDLLCDWVEYNTAKQVSSVARQNGLRGAMSELYGVTHWDFTFEGHKGCGDWQAALGITFRVHHLAWLSMAGEAKRDYPASIGYQSPWYKEYSHIEDHFARVGVALTRGKAVTRVAVIHPIESYWLAFGPNGSGDEMGIRDQAFSDLSHWLLHGLIDFDFISESLLPEQVPGKQNGKSLKVGHCEYDVVVLPNLRTIRSTTLKILREFTKFGGKVIVAGSAPELIDAVVPKTTPLIENSKSVLWSHQSIISALDQYRDLKIFTDQGSPADNLLYQMRVDGGNRFVFVCNRDRDNPVQTVVKFKGSWSVEKMDTLTGKQSALYSHVEDGWTSFPYRFEGCASLLVRLSSYCSNTAILAKSNNISSVLTDISPSMSLESLEFSEPNVLLLDFAEYKLDDEVWSQPTEVLRIDNEIRSRLGMPRKGQAWRQPWSVPTSERGAKAQVTMRFIINSSFDVDDITNLALEDAKTMKIVVNDYSVNSNKEDSPYWVDEAINTVEIPKNTIKKGLNTVTLSFPFGILTNIERIYLLGAFTVSLNGRDATLNPVSTRLLNWGNIAGQGFPFYVGNLTYNCSIKVTKAASQNDATLWVPHFLNPVLTVKNTETGSKIGTIAFQPRRLSLGCLAEGTHKISITAYGNRFNSFGHIHVPEWLGGCMPDMWRTGGDWWTDNYVLRAVGILECPRIEMSLITTEEMDTEKSNAGGDWIVVGNKE